MPDEIIENPTYMEHIRYFFEEIDLDHMKKKGIDFSTYEKLKERSTDVYFQTLPPNANMPPEADRKWSFERSQTFMNWIRNGHPLGKPKLVQLSTPDPDVGRIRKDIRDLDPTEITLLKNAFQGMMDREPSDPESYFAIAGMHWYPLPFKCKHHEARYHSWHRAYLQVFENALRTVPGCESVTLPYWDITVQPSEMLYEFPFDTYTLPIDIHQDYPAGYITQRDDAVQIHTNVTEDNIPHVIDRAMGQPIWEDFITFTGEGIEAAHDAGHGACGITLAMPDAASFDPLFWFFHANWDRLWWEWQVRLQATKPWAFRSTIRGSTAFLEMPFNTLDPFDLTSEQTVDLNALGVDYQPYSGRDLVEESKTAAAEDLVFGTVRGASEMFVPPLKNVSVRLKDINRLEIPGSFRAIIEADGKEVGRKTFFQSSNPKVCDACRSQAMINLDFIVPIKEIEGKSLRAKIHVLVPEPGLDSRFPLHACGNPTLNIRHLIQADH